MSDQPTWTTIHAQIHQLRKDAAQWHADSPDEADFMPLFACAADPIIEAAERAGGDCCESAHMMIDEILIELGYMDAAERQT